MDKGYETLLCLAYVAGPDNIPLLARTTLIAFGIAGALLDPAWAKRLMDMCVAEGAPDLRTNPGWPEFIKDFPLAAE